MYRWACVLMVAVVVLVRCAPAPAHGGRAGPAVARYYYPAYYGPPVYYFNPGYVVPEVLVCPVPVLPAAPAPLPYAAPTAAPPSQTGEPPLNREAGRGAPKVTESRSLSKSGGANLETSCCRVGFWNVTDRDLTLRIDGQARPLARNQSLTLQLRRQFSWQVDQNGPQTAQVPADKTTLEIVIRR